MKNSNQNYEFKSKSELYFSYYLEQLQEEGFIDKWLYEDFTLLLTDKYERYYLKELKVKTVRGSEFLLHPSSITADFTIIWNIKAENIFYSNPHKPVKSVSMIPFRLYSKFVNVGNLISYIETKQANTFRANTSDISFPYKQKFAQDKHGVYIQKVVSFNLNLKPICLFFSTFTPNKVVEEEVYRKTVKKNGKIIHKPGESKIKYPIRTLNEFLTLSKENYG